jgi:hypothetical protein
VLFFSLVLILNWERDLGIALDDLFLFLLNLMRGFFFQLGEA